jgi:uncharacterized iron-regulated membrane protein
MRKLLLKLHLYVSFVAGLFIAILCVTGGIMAFETELADLLHAKRIFVTPGPRTLSLAEISAAVLNKFPDEHIGGYSVAVSPNRSYRVELRRGAVFVNPYTAEILDVQSGPDRVAEIFSAIHMFHIRLLFLDRPAWGKKIMTYSSIGMGFMALSGLYLWWPQKRARIEWRGRDKLFSRRTWWELHNTVGIFSLLFLLLLAVTGALIGFERQIVPLFYKLTASAPSAKPLPPDPHAPDAQPITPDQALAIARAALPGAAPFHINVPKPDGVYQIRARYPEDLTPAGRSQVMVDQFSGKVLFAEGSRTAPAGERLHTLNRAIHTGDVFGLLSKIAMSLASLMGLVLFVSGLAIWWKGRKTTDRDRPSAGKTCVAVSST